MAPWSLLQPACAAVLLALLVACPAPDAGLVASENSGTSRGPEPSGTGSTGTTARDAKSSPTGGQQGGKAPLGSAATALEFAPNAEIAAVQQEATLILLGFMKDDLSPVGMPGPDSRPAFEWKQPNREVSWPVRVQIPVPRDPDLRFVAVIDVDGHGRLSPGDHLSSALPLGSDPDEETVFTIESTLPGLAPDSDRGDERIPGGLPPDPPGRILPQVSWVVLDSNPRVPFLRTTRVLVAGYHPSEMKQGVPVVGMPPSYTWVSDELPVTWPLRLQIPWPVNLTLFVILDMDGNSAPDRGELCSGPLPHLEVPRQSDELSLVLAQAWWPDDPEAAQATSY